MQKPWIEFRKWQYEEDILHFEVEASDGKFSGAQEFYLDKEQLVDLGSRLRAFPRDAHDEVVLELGEPVGRWAYWVRLRFWVCDAVGHAALTVDLANNLKPPHGRTIGFTIQAEVASLNCLGERIASWVVSDEPSFRQELTPSWA
jgi:hypothetical protein